MQQKEICNCDKYNIKIRFADIDKYTCRSTIFYVQTINNPQYRM